MRRFQCQKLSEWQFNVGVYRVPDSVHFYQLQITDIPELVPVHLWPDHAITNPIPLSCVELA